MTGLKGDIPDYVSAAALTVSTAAIFMSFVLPSLDSSSSPSSHPYPVYITLPKAVPLGRGAARLRPSGLTSANTNAPLVMTIGNVFEGARAANAVAMAGRPREPSAVEFDLSGAHGQAQAAKGGSTIDIRKTVRLNGADAGAALVRVTPSSSLLVSRQEFRQLLAKAGFGELADEVGTGGLMSFDELRRIGIAVRYDPDSDRILVST